MVNQNLNNYVEIDYKSQSSFSQTSLNSDNSISQATHSITSDSADYSSQNSFNYQTQAQEINSADSDSNLNNGVVYNKQGIINSPYNQFNPRYAMNQFHQQNLIQPNYYRNPYLGENLWGINDLFRGDDFKKQITQDYLNETKSDVDFIERLQNLQKNNEQNVITTEKHLLMNEYNQKSTKFMKTGCDSERKKEFAHDDRRMNFCDYENSDDDLEKKNENSERDQKDSKKRAKKKFLSENQKDDKYWCRRIKNNVAAKKSRDARRLKESQIAKNASFLETENENLKIKLEDLRKENEKLQIKLRQYEKNY